MCTTTSHGETTPTSYDELVARLDEAEADRAALWTEIRRLRAGMLGAAGALQAAVTGLGST